MPHVISYYLHGYRSPNYLLIFVKHIITLYCTKSRSGSVPWWFLNQFHGAQGCITAYCLFFHLSKVKPFSCHMSMLIHTSNILNILVHCATLAATQLHYCCSTINKQWRQVLGCYTVHASVPEYDLFSRSEMHHTAHVKHTDIHWSNDNANLTAFCYSESMKISQVSSWTSPSEWKSWQNKIHGTKELHLYAFQPQLRW